MQIGILTFHRALNYGAVWQCWALTKFCTQLGYETYVIDYAPTGIWKYRYFLCKRPDRIYDRCKMLYSFNRFYKKMPRSQYYGESCELIKKNPPLYDIYIVGSDQVWAEDKTAGNIGSYMLDFAPKTVKRVAYAASQGGSIARDPIFLKELRNFSAISLREPTCKEQLSMLAEMSVEDVCDPSLLLKSQEYLRQEKYVRNMPKHYIAVFDLNNEPLTKSCALRLKEELGYPLVSLTGGVRGWCDKNLLGLSPEQWMYVMSHADFICTNSFHGTAFSIVLRKPFVSVAGKGLVTSVKDDRKINILTQCGLMSQYITNEDEIKRALCIDYSCAESHIEEYRKRSLEWLKQALEK